MNESLEREGELQRQLRRTKESLISVALRLQVAIKVSQEDEITITSLQAQANESKTREIASERMAQEAGEMITSLTYEINLLKRKLKLLEEKANASQPHGSRDTYKIADMEVDAMKSKSKHSFDKGNIGSEIMESATPFDQWKMNQFIFSPDTPAASDNYDEKVVQMLLAATSEVTDVINRPTKNSIIKRRDFSTLKPISNVNSSNGANIYETVDINFLDNPELPSFKALGIGSLVKKSVSTDPLFFLDSSAPTMWGSSKNKIDRNNMARNNIWNATSNSNVNLSHSLPSQGNMQSSVASDTARRNTNINTHKSLRHSNNSIETKQKANHGINSIIV